MSPLLLLGKWGPRTSGSVGTLDRQEKNGLSGPDSGVHPWLSPPKDQHTNPDIVSCPNPSPIPEGC